VIVNKPPKIAGKLIFITLISFILGVGLNMDLVQAISIVFFGLFVLNTKKLILPEWRIFTVFIVGVVAYSFLGINKIAWKQDFKNYIYIIYGIIMFYNFIKYLPASILLKYFTNINIIIAALYLCFYFNLLPNIYLRDGELAEYKNYKTPGPTTQIFYFIPIFLLFRNKLDNKLIYLNFTFGCIASFINGSLQNIIILIVVYLLYFLSMIKFRKIKYRFHILVFTILFFYIISNYLPSNYIEKLLFVFDPLQAQTVQTRISDVEYMLESGHPQNMLFGDGIGVSSNVFRINPFNPKLSGYNTFLEIDNGFYYVFHRFGFLGIVSFLLFHLIAIIKPAAPIKFKVSYAVFFLITNILSIHYFTRPVTAFFIVLLLTSLYDKKNDNLKTITRHPKMISDSNQKFSNGITTSN
jgi:hypothetical protein